MASCPPTGASLSLSLDSVKAIQTFGVGVREFQEDVLTYNRVFLTVDVSYITSYCPALDSLQRPRRHTQREGLTVTTTFIRFSTNLSSFNRNSSQSYHVVNRWTLRSKHDLLGLS